MTMKKRIFWITVLIIMAAIVIAICISYFTGSQATEFDGTLVNSGIEFPTLL